MALLAPLYEWISHHMFCVFHALTGLYCPGCGGTRSVFYLLTGHPLLSLQYHPIVLYALCSVSYVGIRLLCSRLRADGRKPYHPSPAWLWGALAVILLNWIVKNLFLLAWGIDLLP